MPLQQEMEDLSPWHQIIEIDGIKTPGRWDARQQADFLKANAPWPLGPTILDAGGNAGGISIYLQGNGRQLTVVESSARYEKQFQLAAEHGCAPNVSFVRQSLFDVHEMGAFDCVMMLGLFYHFRYPHMFLDYCAALDCTRFVFSTQTTKSDQLVLWNRSQIKAYESRGFLGWQPSMKQFLMMLKASGFRIDADFSVDNKDFTNDYYVFCSKPERLEIDIPSIQKLSRSPSFWL
ncbi:MAG: methyltransferase domain-containing protein [Pseudomonadota bacterium]